MKNKILRGLFYFFLVVALIAASCMDSTGVALIWVYVILLISLTYLILFLWINYDIEFKKYR